jgi:hypothetical protein
MGNCPKSVTISSSLPAGTTFQKLRVSYLDLICGQCLGHREHFGISSPVSTFLIPVTKRVNFNGVRPQITPSNSGTALFFGYDSKLECRECFGYTFEMGFSSSRRTLESMPSF